MTTLLICVSKNLIIPGLQICYTYLIENITKHQGTPSLDFDLTLSLFGTPCTVHCRAVYVFIMFCLTYCHHGLLEKISY